MTNIFSPGSEEDFTEQLVSEGLRLVRDELLEIGRLEAVKHFKCEVRLVSESFDETTDTWNFHWDAVA